MPNRKPNKKQTRPNTHPNTKKDHKTKMMVATTMAGIVGTVALFISGYLISQGGHRILSIWVGYGGIVIVLLSGALFLHSEETSKLITPSSPKPKSPAPAPPLTKSDMSNQPINISSVNQSGGITAHTVNVGDPQRGIPNSLIPDIQRILGATAKLETAIEYHPSDSEAYKLASSIAGACEVAGITPSMIAGQRPYEAGVIISCTNGEAEAQANAIKQVLTMARIAAVVRSSNGPGNNVFISVGPK